MQVKYVGNSPARRLPWGTVKRGETFEAPDEYRGYKTAILFSRSPSFEIIEAKAAKSKKPAKAGEE